MQVPPTLKSWQELSSPQRQVAANLLIKAHDAFLRDGRGLEFYQYQTEFRDAVYRGLVCRDETEFFYEISRQAGKTTTIAETVAFVCSIADIFFDLKNRPFGVGFFAPREEQYKTDWIRLRDILPDIAGLYGLVEMVNNDHLIQYGRPVMGPDGKVKKIVAKIEIHGFSLGEGTKVESKTLDLAVIEEAQDIDDEKVDKEVRPMLTSTNGFIVFIGVAGYRKCYFKKGVDAGRNVIRWAYDRVIECRRDLYIQTGREYHLYYEMFIEKEKNRIGRQITDAFRTQYMLEWVTEVGNFMSEHELALLKHDTIRLRSKWVRVGIDFAKEHDFTVVTITSELGQRLASLRINGTRYQDQVPLLLKWIKEWCESHYYYTYEKDEDGNQIEHKEALEVEWVQYDHTGVGNAVGEMLDSQCVWRVIARDLSGPTNADMFQQWLLYIAVGLGIAKGDVPDTGQKRFEYSAEDENVEIFETEVTDAEKSYKGQLKILAVHAPEGKKDAHDDTLYSYVLSIYEGEVEASLGVASV